MTELAPLCRLEPPIDWRRTMRRVKQLVSTDEFGLVALCEDNTLWSLTKRDGWTPLLDVPQPPMDEFDED